jgi:hypothetical protein
VIGESEYGINYAGYVIHSAIHAVREDALWIAHFHTRDGMGASAHAEGLLPLSQRALYIIPRLGYHDYEGVALNLDERERLQADLARITSSCCCATTARWRWAARRAMPGRRSIGGSLLGAGGRAGRRARPCAAGARFRGGGSQAPVG